MKFSALASTAQQLDHVAALRSGETTLAGLEIDTDLGWELLISLAAGGRATHEEIDAALADDRTASGNQSAAHARAALPTPEDKDRVWASVFDQAGLPNAIVRASGLGFLRAHDTSLLAPYVDRFFASLLDIWQNRSHAIVEEIVDGFYPAPLANKQLRDATAGWLDANPDAAPALRRMIIEHLAGIERALTAQAADRTHRD